DRPIIEYVADILDNFRLGSIALFDGPRCFVGHVQVDIAERGNPHVMEPTPTLDVLHATTLDSANRDSQRIVRPGSFPVSLIVRARCSASWLRNRGPACSDGCRVVQEIAAVE